MAKNLKYPTTGWHPKLGFKSFTTEEELAEAPGEGFIFSKIPFPKVVYSPEGHHKTVHHQQDLDDHLAAGYLESPPSKSEVDKLKEEIEFHKNQIKEAKKKLDDADAKG